jgi:hypothetical protein
MRFEVFTALNAKITALKAVEGKMGRDARQCKASYSRILCLLL